MSDEEIRHFLVTRNSVHGLVSVKVYHDLNVAYDAYCAKEAWCARHTGLDCVLLGADRLSTCIATHGNWFDEPNHLYEALFRDVASPSQQSEEES